MDKLYKTLHNKLQIGWLIDWRLTSSEQFFSYIQDKKNI